MLFETVRLKNLFSYYGEVVFDLAVKDDSRNIVIISGRNGYGKTSFINALKLLFLGPDELRRTVFADSRLSVQQYLLGLGSDWRGALNRVARHEQRQAEYYVELVWREDAGVVTARRSWQVVEDKAVEALRVEPRFAELVLAGDEAQEFLSRRLPSHVLPYFIYDAEQVQRLAEANRQSQMQQVEKLLDLAAVDTLDEYLEKNVVDWRRQGLAPEEQTRLQRLSAELALKLADQEQDQLKKQEFLEQIAASEHDSDKLTRFLDSMRAFALQRDEAGIKLRHSDLRNLLEQWCQRLFEEISKEAPLLANPDLVAAAHDTARRGASDPAAMLSREMKSIFAKLPSQLLDEPPQPQPALTQTQRSFLRSKLERLAQLLVLGPDSSSVDGFMLSSAVAESLVSRLSYFKEARTERVRIATDLQDISRTKREMAELESKLDDISHLAENERTAYKERKQQLEELQSRRDNLNREIGKIDLEMSRRKGEIEAKQREIRDQESKVREGEELSLRVRLAKQLQGAFRAYRQSLKDRRRKQIEEALNERFNQLMSSHKLIAKIAVGETFALEYLDDKNRPIGLANISAGMKQLVAQSLLWALKDVAGKTAPLVVDTPLARIDRKNQENLIREYYPKAGRQVIILPTDSEVDERKYRLLLPHVYREYRLDNPAGDRSQASEAPMYALAA